MHTATVVVQQNAAAHVIRQSCSAAATMTAAAAAAAAVLLLVMRPSNDHPAMAPDTPISAYSAFYPTFILLLRILQESLQGRATAEPNGCAV